MNKCQGSNLCHLVTRLKHAYKLSQKWPNAFAFTRLAIPITISFVNYKYKAYIFAIHFHVSNGRHKYPCLNGIKDKTKKLQKNMK